MIEGTALVTGASRGIGAAIVRQLVGHGVTVHALARPSASLASICAETGASPVPVDLADTAALEETLSGLTPNIVVSNAGIITARGALHEMDRRAIDDMVAVNLTAVMHTLRLVIPAMVERGTGDIVIVGSIGGRFAFPGLAAYGATKAALTSLADGLRLDLHGTGVRVTEITPGRVETDIALKAMGNDRKMMQAITARMPPSKPEDIADAVIAALVMPRRSNVTHLEVVPTRQTMGGGLFAEVEPDD